MSEYSSSDTDLTAASRITQGRSKSPEHLLGRIGQAISARSSLYARLGAEMAREAWTR